MRCQSLSDSSLTPQLKHLSRPPPTCQNKNPDVVSCVQVKILNLATRGLSHNHVFWSPEYADSMPTGPLVKIRGANTTNLCSNKILNASHSDI